MMDKPEKINDSLSLFSLDGSLDFGTDAYLLSAYVKNQSAEFTPSLAQETA